MIDPAGKFVLVPDKGLDRTFIYRLDAANATLTPADPPSVQSQPGAAPRHGAFHPSSPYAYVINEIQSTVTAFRYDRSRGALQELQTISITWSFAVWGLDMVSPL